MLLASVLMSGISLLQAQSSEQLFKKNCKKCHGEDGRGHTMVGKMVKAPDLTSDAVRKASDADLAAIISKGKGKMPGFDEKLGGEAGVTKVLAYLRSLAK